MVQLAIEGHPTRGSEVIKIDIPKGYEFTGVDDDNQQVVLTKIQPQYPATYEECCMVLDKRTFLGFNGLSLGEIELYRPFIKLMRCRDAYWKIAGEQMELGRPWEVLRGENTYYI